MNPFKSHRLMLCVVAIAAAAAGSTAYFRFSCRSACTVKLETTAISPVPVDSAAHSFTAMNSSAATTNREKSASAPVIRPAGTENSRATNNPIVAVLPPSLIASARTTSWDPSASAALEHFLAAIFDADGDGMLNDMERINAVRSLRDAVWPTTPNAPPENFPEAADDAQGLIATATLSARDRRLHHDVDEARRRDRQDGGGIAQIQSDLRAEIVRRFRTDDDGHLTVDEFARYMVHRNAGSPAADLNGDGRVNDDDLRVFLDVASPID